MKALAWVGSTLYGGGVTDYNPALYSIDPNDGSTTLIGTGIYTYNALAYDGTTLYGGGSYFFKVETTTGAQTLIKSGVSIGDMVYYNGTLYGGNYSGQFFSIDTSTGNITNIGSAGPYAIRGLTLSNNIIYGIDLYGTLFSINPSTGIQTFIADNTLTGTNALAPVSVPVVPEPVRVIGESSTYYWSLQIAYDNASDGDVIQAKAELFNEDIYIDDYSNKSVILQGGYNEDFSEMTGMTSIIGDMMIYNGSISIENIQLQ